MQSLPNGARLMAYSEIPQAGDLFLWCATDSWTTLHAGDSTLLHLPVYTIRQRVGQNSLLFATMREK